MELCVTIVAVLALVFVAVNFLAYVVLRLIAVFRRKSAEREDDE